jgi:cobalt-zinc-cadmium efflux system outer membrane protein
MTMQREPLCPPFLRGREYGRWSTNLMLVAALAVATPLCAQERLAKPGAARAVAAKSTRTASKLLIARSAEPSSEPASEPAAANAQNTTLDYLTRLTLENHPLLRRDAARIDSAAGQSLQKGLYPNPRFDTNNPQVFNGKNSMFNVGFQQEIVVKGKLRLDRAAALRSQQQSQLSMVQDKYGLLTDLRSQFYTTLAAQYRVDVFNRLLKLTGSSVTIAKERAKGGTGDQTEVLLLTIDFDRTRADLANAKRVLVGEKQQLAAIVGFPGLVQENVIGALAASPPSFDEPFMERFVTNENAQVQIAKIDIDKNKILLQRAEVEPYPNLTLGPAYNYGLTKGNEQYWFNIIFPIPVSNRNQGNIQSARANVSDSVESLSAVQLDLLRQLADAFSAHRGALVQAQQYKERIIPDARESLRLARSGFEAGLFDFSVYLQAQRTLIDGSKAYVDILEKVWTTAATVAGLLQIDQFP